MNPSRYSSQQPAANERRRSSVDHDANTEQIIRFVRDCQTVKREPTDLGLRRKAVLPGIGQTASQENGFRRSSLEEDYNSLDVTYESDPDYNDLDIYMSPRRMSPRISLGNRGIVPGNQVNGLSRSTTDRPISRAGRPTQNGSYQKRFKTEKNRKNAAEARQLPPINDQFERPGAPVPDERPRRVRPSSPGLARERTRPVRPTSPRPGTRRANRSELLREYSIVQNDLPRRPSAPSPPSNADLVRDEQIDIIKFD